MLRALWVFTASLLIAMPAFASNVVSLSYAVTNVTTSAYVTLSASTPINTSRLLVCDNSGHIVKIAVGAASSEVDLFSAPLNACVLIPVAPILLSGVRLSLKAVDASATTGFSVVSFLP